MNREVLDGYTFANMLRSGAAALGEKREEVNLLNVFPIPDGDTGDNMFMTIDSGANELSGKTDASWSKRQFRCYPFAYLCRYSSWYGRI